MERSTSYTGAMAEAAGDGQGGTLVRATQIAREAEVRRSPNGVRFATYGETGVPGPDLDRMLEAVPEPIAKALKGNTYFFVPVALREPDAADPARRAREEAPEQAMVAPAWTDDLSDAAICHRNVDLDHGHRGVFISTRLMGDRFALSFEFFINVAHAFSDEAGVPERFAELAWQQAQSGIRGETSLDAWEARNLALGRPANWEPEPPSAPATSRRARAFGSGTGSSRSFDTAGPTQGVVPSLSAGEAEVVVANGKERGIFAETAFSDAVAVYLLSLALDFDYSELRERDYPLLAPGALAERLRLVAELYPPNAGYEFAIRYRRRA